MSDYESGLMLFAITTVLLILWVAIADGSIKDFKKRVSMKVLSFIWAINFILLHQNR